MLGGRLFGWPLAFPWRSDQRSRASLFFWDRAMSLDADVPPPLCLLCLLMFSVAGFRGVLALLVTIVEGVRWYVLRAIDLCCFILY